MSQWQNKLFGSDGLASFSWVRHTFSSLQQFETNGHHLGGKQAFQQYKMCCQEALSEQTNKQIPISLLFVPILTPKGLKCSDNLDESGQFVKVVSTVMTEVKEMSEATGGFLR